MGCTCSSWSPVWGDADELWLQDGDGHLNYLLLRAGKVLMGGDMLPERVEVKKGLAHLSEGPSYFIQDQASGKRFRIHIQDLSAIQSFCSKAEIVFQVQIDTNKLCLEDGEGGSNYLLFRDQMVSLGGDALPEPIEVTEGLSHFSNRTCCCIQDQATGEWVDVRKEDLEAIRAFCIKAKILFEVVDDEVAKRRTSEVTKRRTGEVAKRRACVDDLEAPAIVSITTDASSRDSVTPEWSLPTDAQEVVTTTTDASSRTSETPERSRQATSMSFDTEEGSSEIPLAAGGNFTAALTRAGQLLSWGDQYFSAPRLKRGERYTAVFAGFIYTAAFTSAGRLVCWGDVDFGPAPALKPGERYTSVAVHGFYTAALTSTGQYLCWGTQEDPEVPALQPGERFIALSAYWRHTAALTSNGRLLCWGNDDHGQVSHVPALAALGPGESYTALSAGGYHTAALTSAGRLMCWGRDDEGQVSAVPALQPGERYTGLAAGGGHTAALTSAGRLLCWGRACSGSNSKAPPLQLGECYTAVAAGETHTAALTSAGRLLCWGDDSHGQVSKVPALGPDDCWPVLVEDCGEDGQ